MNNWMFRSVVYPEKPEDRGKVLTKEDLDRLGGFARVIAMWMEMRSGADAAGNGPSQGGVLYARLGHNDAAGYTEKPDGISGVMDAAGRASSRDARKLVPGR